MLPARKRAVALAHRQPTTIRSRAQHTQTTRSDSSRTANITPSDSDVILTGAAKLMADAIAEEAAGSSRSGRSRDHLVNTQGPVWTGDEAQEDAVLRMLVDKYKPLRTGDGVKWNSSDEKIKGWMKGLKLEPRIGSSPNTATDIEASEEDSQPIHRTTIPPHLHRPWHSTYTGHTEKEDTPKIKYGTFIRSRATGDDLTNILELQIPANADAKTKARLRVARKAGKAVRRFDKAREGALDYKLGVEEGDLFVEHDEEMDDEQFRGNRQIKGSSVLGGGKGGASGLRAWAGLVEDRIQVGSHDGGGWS
jgi:aarF domain-containing kinase